MSKISCVAARKHEDSCDFANVRAGFAMCLHEFLYGKILKQYYKGGIQHEYFTES